MDLFQYGDYVQNAWTSYLIPLSALNAAGKTISSILVADRESLSTRVWWFDDVEFRYVTKLNEKGKKKKE